jgi:hypothetical protein
MSRRDYKVDLPIEVQERIQNISDIYKIVTTKLTPIAKVIHYIQLMRHALKLCSLMMLF